MTMVNSQNTAAANQLNSQTQSQLAAQAIIAAPPQVVGMPDFHDTTTTSALPPQ